MEKIWVHVLRGYTGYMYRFCGVYKKIYISYVWGVSIQEKDYVVFLKRRVRPTINVLLLLFPLFSIFLMFFFLKRYVILLREWYVRLILYSIFVFKSWFPKSYCLHRIDLSLRTFCHRHYLVYRYEMSMSHMTTDMSSLS